jgi:hypothetical protein
MRAFSIRIIETKKILHNQKQGRLENFKAGVINFSGEVF